MKALYLFALLLMSGCAVTPASWSSAVAACESFDGVYAYAAYKNTVECVDGTLIMPRGL